MSHHPTGRPDIDVAPGTWKEGGQAKSHSAAGRDAALVDAVRNYRRSHEHEIIRELLEFLSIPNMENNRAEMRRNAEFLRAAMEKRGISAQLHETATNPIVCGELKVPGATQTLTFYSHYDGVPVDETEWTDSHPFKPVYRTSKLEANATDPKPAPLPAPGEAFDEDARIYARSASDDKGPIIAMFAALDALLASGIPLRNNLKFIFEGEEESGSRHFPDFVRQNPEAVQADAFFICDGPAYYTGVPTLWFGVRGTVMAHVTVYGPNVILHAGHFTNFAPNPAQKLIDLVSTMVSADGRVAIKGFYDNVDPLGETELGALRAAPEVEGKLSDLYGFTRTTSTGYLESLQQPGLNVAGISSGWVDKEARYVIPHSATASIMLLPVQGTDPDLMLEQLRAHIAGQGYHVVSEEPVDELRREHPNIAKVTSNLDWYTPGLRTSMDLPISKRIMDALGEEAGHNALFIPAIGSAIGIYPVLQQELGIPTLLVSTVNPDNFQHGPNENIRIGNFWVGIETFAALMMVAAG